MSRELPWRVARRLARSVVLAMFAGRLVCVPATADPRVALSARRVIYPGDIISSETLGETINIAASPGYGTVSEGKELLIGKRAKRTLLPGQPILIADVENPRVVVNGSQVRIAYRENNMSIFASGLALQNGSAGDTIRVRNSDTGLSVSGVVQPDGTVAVGDN